MDMEPSRLWSIHPGIGLESFTLGASLQGILTIIKQDQTTFTAIDVGYSQTSPLTSPIVVTLPDNGIRLRFDGQDQRLRLIEIMDFRKCRLSYKGSELVKQKEDTFVTAGPTFRRVYQIFGSAYPGEYMPPAQGSYAGTYVLSWSGVAFSFPLQHTAWSPTKDHVSLLGSHAASPATHMAIFEGTRWVDTRNELFTKTPSGMRMLQTSSKVLPAEIEAVCITEKAEIEILRRSPAAPFVIKLNETTPEDLITELGPPDDKHKRNLRAFDSTHKRTGSNSNLRTNGRHISSPPSSYSSTATDTYDTEFDHDTTDSDPLLRASRETYWCYYAHGLDILVGLPTSQPTAAIGRPVNASLRMSPNLVVTKVILHGNVPGSYSFNRHRRIRWTINFSASNVRLSSESNFDRDMKPLLLRTFAGTMTEAEMAEGKIVYRSYNNDPNDSSFYLPDADQDLVEGGGSEQWLGNTRLYQYPHLAFEVMENSSVSVLAVS